MSECLAADVFAEAARLVLELRERETATVAAAAELLAQRLLEGGTVYTFGTGHSRTVAMELAGRAGGLVGVEELALDDLVAAGQARKTDLLDGSLERQPEAAHAVLAGHALGSSDAFVIISHSGCNGAPVEMALVAKERGLPVVAVTSLAHSRAVPSRHPSGARLFEVANISIDTGAPYADTVLELVPGARVCSVSTFAGVVVAQALTAEIGARYIAAGVPPPLLVSRNLAQP